MLKNINCITAVINLEGIEKIKTEKKKMTAKQSEEYFFLQRCVRKRRRAQDMGGFDLTSSPPCWCTEQKRTKSFGSLTLLLCKTLAISFVHQHDRLVT